MTDWVRWQWENKRDQLVAVLHAANREHTRIFDLGQQSEESINAAEAPSYRQMAEADRLLAVAVAQLEYPGGES